MKTNIARSIACMAVLALTGTLLCHGQAPGSRIALRVDGLTSEERDRLNLDLGERGDLRISFACVPAGILILEPVRSDRTADSVRALVAAALIDRLPADRRTEMPLSLSQAEELCAAQRNH